MFGLGSRSTPAASKAVDNSSARFLFVEVVEARGLLPCVKNTTSDPYAMVVLHDLGGREIKNETFYTKQKNGTISPSWGERFTLGHHYSLDSDADLPSLCVNFFHKAAFSVSETPLGVVSLPLESIPADGTQVDNWYPLEMVGRMKSVSGQARLRLRFSRPASRGVDSDDDRDIEAGEETSLLESADASEATTPVGEHDMSPNLLRVTAIKAKGLLPMDKPMFGGVGTSDPQVRIKINGVEKRTKFIRKTLNPVWEEEFVFEDVLDSSHSLVVTVEDHNDYKPTADFIGRVAIPLNAFDTQKPLKKWYKLLNKEQIADGTDRGEIELHIHWVYDKDVQKKLEEKRRKAENSQVSQMTKRVSNIANQLGKAAGFEKDEDSNDEMTDGEQDHAIELERTSKKTDEEKASEKQKEDEKKKELSEIEIKDGDYQVLVHIIEARDLKGENEDGTSDPIVFVECFGQKRNTIVIKQTTSCVFDELFIFNLKDIDKEAFEEGLVRISCYDSTILSMIGGKNKMIGAFAIDAPMVYTMSKDHEMYRQWVPLMDDEDADDVGVQGYLKISISIVGPGEKVKVHDEDAERAAEIAREAKVGADIGSLCLSTPMIQKEWKFLVVKVHKAEGLPVMDGKVGAGFATVSDAKTDAFCQLSFAGGKALKTRVSKVVGASRNQINPVFNYELWYPVSLPTMTQTVKFSVWDHDQLQNELIGNVTESLSSIRKSPQQFIPRRWYNMYGAPEFKTEKLAANISKGLSAVAKTAKQTLGAEIDWSEYYNQAPDKASTFKGRVLLEFSVQDKRPPKYDKQDIKPFRRKIKPLKSTLEPKTREYSLQALVICGNDLPSLNAITTQQYRVRISLGIHEICTKAVKLEGGMCRWNEFLKSEKLLLPEDVSQLPDVFIYLVNEDNKPVCFARVSPCVLRDKASKTSELMGFEDKTQWYLLREDKTIDALPEDMFPGSLLIKLGFGTWRDADSQRNTWMQCMENAKRGSPHQVRVHVYQGRNLPAADSNGLCDPFVKVNFMGKQCKTEIQKKTLFPVYYQTVVFDNMTISAEEDYQYASQVCLRLYDYDDFDAPDYLGTVQIPLSDAYLTPLNKKNSVDPDDVTKYPLPKWYKVFYEVPGDSQGELLVLVQLVPLFGQTLPMREPKDFPSIRPETVSAFIEFIAIGIRDLSPYQMQSMQNVFMDIELHSFKTKYVSSTKPSKRPDPNNPNFLEQLILPVELPKHSIFATPLCIAAKDTRLGGYFKPTVGVCQIDLSTKLPWCEDTYVAPQRDIFMQSIDDRSQQATSKDMALDPSLVKNNDEVAQQTRKMEQERDTMKRDDDYVVSSEPVSVGAFIKERLNENDTGAGVFSALSHIDFVGQKRRKKDGSDAFVDPDWGQDDSDAPPAWSIGRKKLPSELEMELQTTPFETYSLKRGQVNGFLGSRVKVVGRLKGIVRVVSDRALIESEPILPKTLMDQLLKPKKYVVRLYALRTYNLTEMDFDIFGNPAKSDPYLKVSLGKQVMNDRKNAVDDVLEVDLYKMVSFETELPGVSQLHVELMDKDLVGKDDLIGKTTIDLEDRWFDSRWQDWGRDQMITPGQDLTDPTKVRWKTKPIESRSLYAPGFSLSRGLIDCFVDIMTPEEALTFPPEDVSLPPKQIFEVRVVVWKTRDVPPMDSLEGMSDLFVKVWPEGCDAQETDTHWRCKKGKASFNWRMLFDVELGHNTRAMKFPYLHLQLWDRDILKWNDCAGEGVIDLGRYYRKAYKRGVALKLFEKPQGKAAKRAKEKTALKRSALIEETEDDIPPEEDDEDDLEGDVESQNVASEGQQVSVLPPRDRADSDDDDDVTQSGFDNGIGALPRNTLSLSQKSALSLKREKAAHHKLLLAKPDKLAKKATEEKLKQKMEESNKNNKGETAENDNQEEKTEENVSVWSRLMFWKKHGKGEGEGENDEKEALLKEEEKKKDADDEDVKNMVNTFKNMTGLWDIDPDDSTWYHLETRDKNDPSKVTPMGSICYSVQIWPKDQALLMPAGSARNEPNTNPFLPPPVGRLKFSWNPFVLGSELCGPALCAKFFCCLLCVVFIVLMIFCQPFLNIIINLIFVVY